jgi:hypothetical protein
VLSQVEHKQLVDSSQHVATVKEISAAANILGMPIFSLKNFHFTNNKNFRL